MVLINVLKEPLHKFTCKQCTSKSTKPFSVLTLPNSFRVHVKVHLNSVCADVNNTAPRRKHAFTLTHIVTHCSHTLTSQCTVTAHVSQLTPVSVLLSGELIVMVSTALLTKQCKLNCVVECVCTEGWWAL